MATIPPNTPKAGKSNQLFDKLEEAMSMFDDKTTKLLTSQQEAFIKSLKLLQDGPTSSNVKSSQRWRLIRAQAVLADIFLHLGDEVFLLCAVATTSSALSAQRKNFIAELRCWWDAQSPPSGLKAVASNICEKYSIGSLVSKVSAESEEAESLLSLHETSEIQNKENQSAWSLSDVREHAIATFEVAIHLAGRCILQPGERAAWVGSCLNHLRVFKQLDSVERYETGNKRKRETSQEGQPRAADDRFRARSIETARSTVFQPGYQPIQSTKTLTQGAMEFDSVEAVGQSQAQITSQIETNQMSWLLIAKMADVDKLQSVLGDFLFRGMVSSYARRREDSGSARLTDAVRLHFAYELSEDFILEIWLSPWAGKTIQDAKERSVQDLKVFLGDYLFEGMETCNRRREEEGRGLSADTCAVNVYFPNAQDSSDDYKLEVLLNFERGREIYIKVYHIG